VRNVNPRDASMRLYHCEDARSFRPLWMLEELERPYELVMLPFPPRIHRRDYLQVNPLGTVPFFVHGDLTMTESSAVCHYLVDINAPTLLRVDAAEPDYGRYLNWLYFGEATLTFPQAIVLRYTSLEPLERRQPQVATDYAVWFKARLSAVERALADGRLHLCAERFTAADVSVGYALKLAARRGFDFDKLDHTRRYWHRLEQRDGYRRAMQRQALALSEQGIAPITAF
jgi:glutathione S-transferase